MNQYNYIYLFYHVHLTVIRGARTEARSRWPKPCSDSYDGSGCQVRSSQVHHSDLRTLVSLESS